MGKLIPGKPVIYLSEFHGEVGHRAGTGIHFSWFPTYSFAPFAVPVNCLKEQVYLTGIDSHQDPNLLSYGKEGLT